MSSLDRLSRTIILGYRIYQISQTTYQNDLQNKFEKFTESKGAY